MRNSIYGRIGLSAGGDAVRLSEIDAALHWQKPFQARSIAFGLRRAVKAMMLSSSVFALVATCTYLLSRMGYSDAVCLSIVHLATAFGLLVFWRCGYWGRARLDCFGAALLLLAAALRLHAFIDTLVFGARVDELYRYPYLPVPQDTFLLFLKAEMIVFVGLLLVACAWRLTIGARVEEHSFLLNVQKVPLQIPIIVYLAAVIVDVAVRVMGINFGALTMFATTLSLFGVAAIYFVAARRPSRGGRVAVAIAMAVPLTLLALNKGMKSELFLPMVPAALLFWTGFRSILVRLCFVAIAFVVLALSQLYVHHVRSITWHAEGIDLQSPMDLISTFVEDFGELDQRDALDSTSARINMTIAHAITVILADQNGFEPANVFGPIPATFVPRMLWPDKPVLRPGAVHTSRILGGDRPISEIRSATAPGFATELYLGGWWAGLILGMLAYGFLLAAAQNWALRIAPGFGHLAFCCLLFYWAFRFDENHVVYAYTGIVFVVAFLWALRQLTAALGLKSTVIIQQSL